MQQQEQRQTHPCFHTSRWRWGTCRSRSTDHQKHRSWQRQCRILWSRTSETRCGGNPLSCTLLSVPRGRCHTCDGELHVTSVKLNCVIEIYGVHV